MVNIEIESEREKERKRERDQIVETETEMGNMIASGRDWKIERENKRGRESGIDCGINQGNEKRCKSSEEEWR